MPNWENYRFYKFRYTLKPDGEKKDGFLAFQSLFGDQFLNYHRIMYLSAGFEELGDRALQTQPHFHFHFALPDSGEKDIGNMRKRFQRWIKKDENEKRKGNFLYSLKEELDVKDIYRFFRYPWKQLGRIVTNTTGFVVEKLPPDIDPDDIDKLIALASEEQKRKWEDQINAYNRKMKPDTRDKLFGFLDRINEENAFSSEKDILVKICEFYGTPDESTGLYRSANKQTMLGYLQTAKWKYGLESFEETALKWLN